MKAIRVGICVLTAFAVLAFGGVEPWAAAILEIGSATLLLLWTILAVRRKQIEVYGNGLYLPLLALGGVGLVQVIFGVSIYPYATKVELLKWIACFALFFLAVESFRSVKDWKPLVWFCLSLGFVVSLFGIIQYFTFNGKLYWLVVLHQGGEPFGPFVNYDHFAGFVELVTPLGLAIVLFGAVPRDRLALPALFTAVPIAALMISASRGGIISLLLQILFLGALLRRSENVRNKAFNAVVIAVTAMVLITWLGIGDTLLRFQGLMAENLSQDQRLSISKDSWQIFLHHPWAGTGLGTFKFIYPQYERFYYGEYINHAHNDYLELLAETGLMGGACAALLIGLLFRHGINRLRFARRSTSQAFHAGALVGCAGLLIHGLVDFNFHILSNALLFLLMAALATSPPQPPDPIPDPSLKLDFADREVALSRVSA